MSVNPGTPRMKSVSGLKTMRDAFLEEVSAAMDAGENIFFLTADLGAPALDRIRKNHPERFINVGIAEQNLIGVATGLGLEGAIVYAYAIAPFVTMRCYEQIRVNLAILSQLRPMNVNLIGVGAGFSYDVSGPTHHCLEDLSIMRTFPNFEVISPADWYAAGRLLRYTAGRSGAKYLRFDAKPLPRLYEDFDDRDLDHGFVELRKGSRVCFLSTGFLTHKALEAGERLAAKGNNVGVIDMIKVKGFDEKRLLAVLKSYDQVITMEEGFTGKGGLDSAVGGLILNHRLNLGFQSLGLKDRYLFEVGSREFLHAQNGLDTESILRAAGP